MQDVMGAMSGMMRSTGIGLSPLLPRVVVPAFSFLCTRRALDPSFKMLRRTHFDLD